MTTTASDPLVGRHLDGRYRVESRLASGGMATVYLAHDTRLDRTVALKVMHHNLAQDDTFVDRFIREARSAARLSHPNVVAVYDQGEDAGSVYLAMEYVRGRTLRDVLSERGRLTPREAVEVLERVLSALAAAHHAGLVHRDVKPENVLVSDEGRIKVADFGLARATASAASGGRRTTGVLIGTVAYLSPEQVASGRVDARSDVYAAGVMFYEMLVGQVPFVAESPIAVAYKHVHEDVPPPSARVRVPAALDDLVRSATHRDPDERPDDAAALLAEVVLVRRELPDDADELGEEQPRDGLLPGWGTPDEGETVVLGGRRPAGHARPARTAGHAAPPQDPEGRGLPPVRVPHRWRLPIAVALVVLLAVGIGGAGWWYGAGRWTSAPRLAGMSQADATHRAGGLDFRVATRTAYDEKVGKGDVISTTPAAGARVLRHSTITLVVSRGPERHAVPDLKGRSVAAARTALSAASLDTGDVTYAYSASIPKDQVVRTQPKAGKRLKRDTPVDLVVSKGEAPVEVPDVRGQSSSGARSAIEGAGLQYAESTAYSKTVPEGQVVSQSPAAGSKKAKGTTIDVVLSKGPPLVQVPDVHGLPPGKARKTLEAAGFTVKVRRFGGFGTQVVAQNPKAGSQVKYGSTVRLLVL